MLENTFLVKLGHWLTEANSYPVCQCLVCVLSMGPHFSTTSWPQYKLIKTCTSSLYSSNLLKATLTIETAMGGKRGKTGKGSRSKARIGRLPKKHIDNMVL